MWQGNVWLWTDKMTGHQLSSCEGTYHCWIIQWEWVVSAIRLQPVQLASLHNVETHLDTSYNLGGKAMGRMGVQMVWESPKSEWSRTVWPCHWESMDCRSFKLQEVMEVVVYVVSWENPISSSDQFPGDRTLLSIERREEQHQAIALEMLVDSCPCASGMPCGSVANPRIEDWPNIHSPETTSGTIKFNWQNRQSKQRTTECVQVSITLQTWMIGNTHNRLSSRGCWWQWSSRHPPDPLIMVSSRWCLDVL